MKHMKRIGVLLLAVCLMTALLAGCKDNSYYEQLLPENADAEFAPNVILEPDTPPYNLGGWQEEDDVWWYLDIPSKGTYTVRILYSMPGEYEDNEGWLSFIPDEGESVSEVVTFRPTSEPGSWDNYEYVDVVMKLPKGTAALSLSPFTIAEGQDYFINLRMIEVFSGTMDD